MRRRRQLQVDTSPFLAVLLCAMGSLILVLLIMDRRARLAAKERVAQKVAAREEEAKRRAEAREAARELARLAALSEWEAARDALHEQLQRERAALGEKATALEQELASVRDAKTKEDERLTQLQAQTQAHERAADSEKKALLEQKENVDRLAKKTASMQEALARMQRQLTELEQVLTRLKEQRKGEEGSYSVVPYRGKFGEDREPVYVEFTDKAVVFHPGEVALPTPYPTEKMMAELSRRIKTLDLDKSEVPYLLLLIRPQGILTFYEFQHHVRHLVVDFGYELVDEEWELRFLKQGSAKRPKPTTGVGPTLGTPAVGPSHSHPKPKPKPMPRGPGGLAPVPGPGRGGIGFPPPDVPNGKPGTPPGGQPGQPPAEKPQPKDKPNPEGKGEATEPGDRGGTSSRRPRGPLRNATVGAHRRDHVFVECRGDGIIVYPAQTELTLAQLRANPSNNAMVATARAILARRAKDAKPGRKPVQVRFLVRPDGFRAFHEAYPLLEKLPVSKIRQNLEPDADVFAVMEETH